MRNLLTASLLLSVVTVVMFPSAASAIEFYGDEGEFSYKADNTAHYSIVTDYSGPGGAVTIPSTLGGEPVIGVGSRAFEDKGLTSVTFPSTIGSIDANAFVSNQLGSVTLPRDMLTIQANAFRDSGITSVNMSASTQLQYIGQEAFADNQITAVTFPSGLVILESSSFARNRLAFVQTTSTMTSFFQTAFDDQQRDCEFYDGMFDSPTGGTQYDLTAMALTSIDGGLPPFSAYGQYTEGAPLTFKPENGDSAASICVRPGTALTAGEIPIAPSRTGFTLDGWHTDPNADSVWDFSTQVNGPVTLYAHWTPVKYDVAFVANVPAGEEPADAVLSVPYGARFDSFVPQPTREHYTFDGWFSAASGGTLVPADDTVTGAVTLYAHWTPEAYDVTFDPANGSEAMTTTTTYPETVATPQPEPTREHYTFSGWIDSTTDTPWDFTTTVTENTTLTATWTADTYEVTLDAANGSLPVTVLAPYPTSITDPGAVFLSGHTFVGWADESGGIWSFDTVIGADTALTAIYTENTRTVTGPIQATAGDIIAIAGTGLDPNEEVTIELHSDPVVIARTTADEMGDFTASGTIPSDTPAGQHELVVISASGSASTVITISSTEPEETPRVDSLSGTGVDGASQAVITLILLAAGVGLVTLRRRAAN